MAGTTPNSTCINGFDFTKLNSCLTLFSNLAIETIGNLVKLTSCNLASNNICSTTGSIPTIPSHESTLSSHSNDVQIRNTATEPGVALYSNSNAPTDFGVVLDSGCTNCAYKRTDATAYGPMYPLAPSARLHIMAANGGQLQSHGIATRSFQPTNTKLPAQEHTLHIFNDDDLTMSMHAMSDFTNHPANNTVTLNKYGFQVVDDVGNIICQNSKGVNDKMWFMPPPYKQPHSMLAHGNLFIKHEPNAVFVSYMAGCFCNPCDSTFEKAASKGWLGNLPRITASMIAANRPHSMDTAYGHMNRLRQGLRSTSAIQPTNTSPIDTHQEDLDDHTDEMATMVKDLDDLTPIDKKALAIYFDATGKFPFDALDGSKYILIAVYKNYIHVETLADRSAPSYVKAYRATFDFFKSRGHTLSVARLDNETSTLLETFFKEEVKVSFQFISAGTHRANKAERAIQSFKNHFIACLASVDSTFPMEYWPSLLEQAEITINILRPFADNSNMSAYEGIFKDKYDFLAHPLAPPGTRVVVYDPADNRSSWALHGVAGYYLGPALNHYREMRCYIPSTNGIRISNQCDFFPAKVKLPGASTAEILLAAIDKLQRTVESNLPQHDQLLPAIAELRTATSNYTNNIVPAGPRAPDGLTQAEVNELTQPPVFNNLLSPEPPIIDTVTVQKVPNINIREPQRVDNTPVADVNDTLDGHPLRAHRASRPVSDRYRPLTPKESRNSFMLSLKDRIGQHFRDKQTGEELVIDSVVMPTGTGKGSKTPFFRMFLVEEYQRPTAVRTYAYTPCSEIKWAKYVEWIPRGQSAMALAIMASEPRDLNRAPNQTASGKPLKFNSAMELDPILWSACDAEEWHRLLENTLRPVYFNEIPKGTKVAYYNKQIKEKVKTIDGKEFIEARVRGTLGGNVLDYKGATSANTAEYPLIMTILAAVLHDVKFVDPNTRFVTLDMVDYYLYSPMEILSFMMVLLKDIPIEIVEAYDLKKRAIHGKIYFKVLMSMYGHPAAGHLAQRLFMKTIKPAGYYEDAIISCLIKHDTRTTCGGLIVDDIGLKVKCEEDVLHLVEAIEKVWKVKINWKGDKFLGMDLKWDYNPENPTLEISSNNVIPAAHKRFYLNEELKGAETPMLKKYTRRLRPDEWVPPEKDPIPRPDMKQTVQEFAGTFSHLGRTTRHDIVAAVNEIAETQANPSSETLAQMDRLANYTASYPEGAVLFKATDMILKAQYDSSLKPHARHKVGGIIYLGNNDDSPENIGNITEVVSKTPPNAVASIAEGEYAAGFMIGQKVIHHRYINEALGYPQPPTTLFGDNTTAIGIANDTMKQKHSKAFDKALHWNRDQVRQGILNNVHIDTSNNTSDYFTKAHGTAEHRRQVVNLVKFPQQQTKHW